MEQIQKSPVDVDATWNECEFKAHPLRNLVFLRTDLRPEKIGSIYIPPAQRANYAGLAHTVLMTGTVLSVGPKVRDLKRGDRIAFPRLHLGWWKRMEDGTLVGWVDADTVCGYVTDDTAENDLR